jgi:hypothetical protein
VKHGQSPFFSSAEFRPERFHGHCTREAEELAATLEFIYPWLQ